MENASLAESAVAFMKIAMRLKTTPRTGWTKKGIAHPESVGDHCLMTGMLALPLARARGLDEAKVFRMAALHDAGESIIGDIVRERGAVSHTEQQAAKHVHETAAIAKLFDLTHDAETKAVLIEFLEQKTPEAKLVKECDKLEMLFQALEYENAVSDPNTLVEFWENVAKYIHSDDAWAIFDALKRESRITVPLPTRKTE